MQQKKKKKKKKKAQASIKSKPYALASAALLIKQSALGELVHI